MALSPYIRQLRDHVGSSRLLLPSVSAHIFDDAHRILLVRQRETGLWSTPDGAGFVVRYANGDESQYVSIAFRCRIVDGEARADQDETDAVRFWSHDDANALPGSMWFRAALPMLFACDGGGTFELPTWRPPTPR